jgi:hypothetical protein
LPRTKTHLSLCNGSNLNESNILKFGEEMIHSTPNQIELPIDLHRKINAFYSSKPGWLNGVTCGTGKRTNPLMNSTNTAWKSSPSVFTNKRMPHVSKDPKKLKKMSSTSLVELFTEAAVAGGQALEDGKPRLANKAYDVKAGVYRELRSRGVDAQRSMLTLLYHPDRYVRCAAGTYALDFDPEAAEPVLQALEKLQGFAGHNADMALKMWRNRRTGGAGI